MGAVRKLDYKQQYKVCEKFYQMVVHGDFPGNESEKCLDFFSSFQEIDTRISQITHRYNKGRIWLKIFYVANQIIGCFLFLINVVNQLLMIL